MRTFLLFSALLLLPVYTLFAQPDRLIRPLENEQLLDSLLSDLFLDDQQYASDFDLKKSYHFLYAQSGFAPKPFTPVVR